MGILSEINAATLETVLGSTAVASMVTGFWAYFQRRADRKKFEAQIRQLEANTERTEAENNDLTSARLIRELDRISANNDRLQTSLDLARAELDTLRGKILEYAAREFQHVAEKKALRHEIAELKGLVGGNSLSVPLREAFPVQIPVTPSEYEDEGDETDGSGI